MNPFDDIEQYLQYVGQQRKNSFGKRFRSQFQNTQGTAELAMLAAPNETEYQDFCRAVAAMTTGEKENVELLNSEQIKNIAQRAQADCGNISIFLNGYVLAQKNSEK